MSVFIVWIIVIVWIIAFTKKKNRQGGANGSKPSNNSSQGNYHYQASSMNNTVSRSTGNHVNSSTQGAKQAVAAAQRAAMPRGNAQQANLQKANAQATGAQMAGAQKNSTSGKKDKDQSTTDYLQQKAKADARDHYKEKMEEQRRVNETYGNQPVGGRYELGDPIPNGMKIVYCPYCAAENLVKISYHGDRDCYFCRTRL